MDAFGLTKRMEGNMLTAFDIRKWTDEKEATITLLQMQTYLIVGSFFPRSNKKGEPYGWHIGHYETPNQSSGLNVKAKHSSKPTAHSKAETLPYPENLITAIGLSLVLETNVYIPLDENQKRGLKYAIGTLHDRKQVLVKKGMNSQ